MGQNRTGDCPEEGPGRINGFRPGRRSFSQRGRNRLRKPGTGRLLGTVPWRTTAGPSGILVETSSRRPGPSLMLPFSSLLQGFPKIVRDLARDLLKDVEFSAEGGDVEVDKRILEGLKDPLVHLVRNALDHGIERPEERRAGGKPEKGRLSIAVSSVERGRV